MKLNCMATYSSVYNYCMHLLIINKQAVTKIFLITNKYQTLCEICKFESMKKKNPK